MSLCEYLLPQGPSVLSSMCACSLPSSFLNSTTSKFSVFWNNPPTHYQLVSGYEVKWGVASFSTNASGTLSRTVNQYTVSNNLIPGQLYRVNVISYITLTGPADSTLITSTDRTVRTVPSAPGPIEKSESNFAHNNLQIRWTAPVNTLVTRYEVTIDGTTYNTINSDALYQFTGKVFIPGKSYVISIVTITGTTDVKRSSEHTEWMKITPTKPDPPTNLQCPQNPLDVSLKISWTAPSEPNGNIVMYQINVSPRHLGQIYTSSNETHTNVEGLLPEQMYTFTVRSINDAVDNTSEPSQSLMCKTNVGGNIFSSVQ
nr:phosphatidylinositol phosphatase PTPRQ-like [Crassostrea gigas]